MKTLITALVLSASVSLPAMAVEASSTTNTDISTDVDTSQNSGVSLSGKAKVLPNASISTGDNTARTDVRTSVEADTDANAARSTSTKSTTNVENKSYHRTSGKGHKYGHDR